MRTSICIAAAVAVGAVLACLGGSASALAASAPVSARVTRLSPGDTANMVWISNAVFTVGSPVTEAQRSPDEDQHQAIVTSGFYIGKYEVTQREYQSAVGSNPSLFDKTNGYAANLDRPVDSVTWYEASNYCALLTASALAKSTIATGWVYRLPTEAEWEYACRGKTMRDAASSAITAEQPYSGIPYGDNARSKQGLSQQLGNGLSGAFGSITVWLSGSAAYDLHDTRILVFGYASNADANNGGYGGGDRIAGPNGLAFDYSSGVLPDDTNVAPITYSFAGASIPGNGVYAFDPSAYYLLDFEQGTDYPIGQPLIIQGLPTNRFGGSCQVMYGNDGCGNSWYPTECQNAQTTYGSLCFQIDAAGSYQLPPYAAFSFGGAMQGGMANFDDRQEYNSAVGTLDSTDPAPPYIGMTTNVGSYQPNAFGLFDMHGNVSEWCQDWFADYPSGASIDYAGPASGTAKVVRGGSWADPGVWCRSAARLGMSPDSASSHVGFRIVLAPALPGWKTAVSAVQSQPVLGAYPEREPGKDSLVVITHGWQPFVTPSYPVPDVSWVDAMSNSIGAYLAKQGTDDWQVYGYNWISNAWTFTAPEALYNARGEGANLGNAIAAQGWKRVHLIGHSAGAELIQTASEWIKYFSPTTAVQCTFLDPYVGDDYAGVTNYGKGSDWSDSYFTHDVTGAATEAPLDDAYNVNVTYLDPDKTAESRFYSSPDGEPCRTTVSSHGWPIQFYLNTVAGESDTNYAGFGFPLSLEGGDWGHSAFLYRPGNGTAGDPRPTEVLGIPDPDCGPDAVLVPLAFAALVPDFTEAAAIGNLDGSVLTYTNGADLASDSPAWLAAVIAATNLVDSVSFDARFSSDSGAQGLLTVLWDTNVIGTLDERVTGSEPLHYQLAFPSAAAYSVHMLSFRLDPSADIPSEVAVTNVAVGETGPSQPFSIAPAGEGADGAPLYQLSGPPGFVYDVQASTDPAGTNWSDIAELYDTNGSVGFYDQDSAQYPTRFYRAAVPSMDRSKSP